MLKKKMITVNGLFGLLFVIVILLPIFIYRYKFGSSLSNNQDIWGQFGSYISGIYAPFFSFLTLFLLYKQNQAQVKMNNYQKEHNDASQLRSDAEFYLNVLDKTLTEKITLQSSMICVDSIINILTSRFSHKSIQELRNDDLINIANQIDSQNQKIRNAWIGFNVALASLKNYKNTSFEHHYTSVKLLAAGIFGFDCCVALDNYCYIHSKGQVIFNEYSS